MATDAKISERPLTDPLDGTESVPVVQAGTTKRSLLSTIRTWLAATFTSGAASSTDNAIARFDGTGGKTIQNSSVVIIDTGELGIGVNPPVVPLHIIKTTEQARLGYDATYYVTFTVSSSGNLTIDTVGNTIYTPDTIENTTAGAGIILKSPNNTRYRITVADGGTISVGAA